VVLILFHFAVPFMLLLSRRVKRHSALNLVAGLLLVLTLFDIFWLVVPSFEPSALRVHWTDITLVVGMVGFGCGRSWANWRQAAAAGTRSQAG